MDPALYEKAQARATTEGRSFSFIVCRALAFDLENRVVKADPVPTKLPTPDDQIFTKDVADMLKLSSATVTRRASKPGDVLHAARIRVARKKPFTFSLAKIAALNAGTLVAKVA